MIRKIILLVVAAWLVLGLGTAEASGPLDLAFLRAGGSEIWGSRSDGSGQALLYASRDGEVVGDLAWGRSGTMLYFTSRAGGGATAVWRLVPGSPTARRLGEIPARFGRVWSLAVSPDETTALASCDARTSGYVSTYRLCRLDLLTGDVKVLTEERDENGNMSAPDLSWADTGLFALRETSDGSSITLVDPTSGRTSRRFESTVGLYYEASAPVAFSVTPRGETLTYLTFDFDGQRADRLKVVDSQSERTVHSWSAASLLGDLSASPDASSIAISLLEQDSVKVVDLSSGQMTASIAGATGAAWRPPASYTLDSGFRPETDGYSFRNGTDVVRDDDWDVWKMVFDDGAWSWSRYVLHNAGGDGLFRGGICSGFSTSANTFWERTNDLGGLPWPATVVADLSVSHQYLEFGQASPKELREFIERYHLAQRIDDYTAATSSGTQAFYEHFKRILQSGSKDLPALILKEKLFGSGHVVTPFAISESGGQAVIWVWDNNRPGQARPITIDKTGWSWEYALRREGEAEGQSAVVWSSEKGWIEFIPTSAVVDLMHQTPGGSGVIPAGRATTGGAALAPVTIVSTNATPLFEDASGAVSGFIDGQAVDEVDEVRYLYPDSLEAPLSRVFVISGDSALKRSVSVEATGSFDYTVTDDHGGAQASVTGAPGTDVLDIHASDGSIAYRSGSLKSDLDLVLFRPTQEHVRTMAVQDVSIEADETFTVRAVEDDQGMQVVNGSAIERTYVPVLAATDETTFTAGMQTIGPGETHTIVSDDWVDLANANIILTLDSDSDGQSDDILALQGRIPPWCRRFAVPLTALVVVLFAAAAALLIVAWKRRSLE